MWTRTQLKSNAKVFLKKFYWQAFIVALIVTILSSVLAGSAPNQNGLQFSLFPKYTHSEIIVNNDGQGIFNFSKTPEAQSIVSENIFVDSGFLSTMKPLMPNGLSAVLQFFSITMFALVMLSILLTFSLLEPLSLGAKKFFVEGAREDRASFNHLGYAFRKDYYFNVVMVLAYRALINGFFYLLLIIPGIVKTYAYSMVPYLLADDPTLSPSKALEISDAMTNGHKWEMFILDLSFILWNMLNFVTFGLAQYFVEPYKMATWAQLYLILKPITPAYELDFEIKE